MLSLTAIVTIVFIKKKKKLSLPKNGEGKDESNAAIVDAKNDIVQNVENNETENKEIDVTKNN